MIAALKSLLGDSKVSSSESELYRHSKDESSHKAVEPNAVCFPETVKDIHMVLTYARKNQIAVTPFGAGSGLEGQIIPIKQGISLNTERMNRILDFSPEDMTVTVQPGITRLQLNEFINKHGLQFPIDPGADASIGGMTATNASGTTAVRYGSMRDQILDLEVVLSDGRIIHTGSKAKKSSSGYHLTSLFTGSEGTLGIVTEITLKLHGIPEHEIAARCTFSDLEQCAEAAYAVLLNDIPVKRMELVDAVSIKQVNTYGDYHFPVEHSLFFEFAGTDNVAMNDAEAAKKLMQELNCANWEIAETVQDKNDLWRARHEISPSFRHQPNKNLFGTDVCVPISKLPAMISFARKLLENSELRGGILGHVGDGNFHTLILFDDDKESEIQAATYINEQLVYKAIETGGSCTGEHGVGLGKRKYQAYEHGDALSVMKSMKLLFDPENILNPGKIFLESV